MRRDIILSAVALVVMIASFSYAEDPVYFADPNLKAVVEATLFKTNPTPTDMLGLQWLDAWDRGITNLTGLEYATNLKGGGEVCIYLNRNNITDISPLGGLTKLTCLVLSDNNITDISPLGGLTNLTGLGLSDNNITDISPLAGLTKLKGLYLSANPLNRAACDIYIPIIRANNPGITIYHDPCVQQPDIPTVITLSASDVGQTSARLWGRIEDDGGEACNYTFSYWGDDVPHPTPDWSSETKKTGESFYMDVTDLKPGYVYYYQAYAKNSAGGDEGSVEQFSTPASAPWSFYHITDIHIGGGGDPLRDLAATVNYINFMWTNFPLSKPHFVLVTGDIVDYACTCRRVGLTESVCDVCTEFFEDFNDAMFHLKIPYMVVPGNHDRARWFGGTHFVSCDNGLDCYRERFQTQHVFTWNDILFIGLDSGDGNCRGDGLTDAQFSLLKGLGDQNPNMAKILFMHHPGVDSNTVDTDACGNQSIERIGGTVGEKPFNFLDWCDANNVKLVLAGHTHEDHVFDRNAQTPNESTKTRYVQTPKCTEGPAQLRKIEIIGNRVNINPVKKLGELFYTEADLNSPGNLHIYDSAGRHVGTDDKNNVEYGIPLVSLYA